MLVWIGVSSFLVRDALIRKQRDSLSFVFCPLSCHLSSFDRSLFASPLIIPSSLVSSVFF